MPSIFAPQTPITNDTGAVVLGFQGAPNVLYDRTLVGATTYTISTAGTTGGETMSVTLRGPYAYSFASSVAMAWAGGIAPTPACSTSAFDRIRLEVLQDGSLLGTVQAMGASVPVTPPAHYLNVSGVNQNAYAPATAANDGSDSFISIREWLSLTSTYAPSTFAPLIGRWGGNSSSAAISEYLFGLAPPGYLALSYYDANGNYQGCSSSAQLSAALANAAGLWLRVDLNGGTETINGVAPGTAVFYTSPGGSTPEWTQLGTVVTATQSGLNHVGTNAAPIIFGDSNAYNWTTNTCHVYEIIVENSSTILANPNFQAQPTTAIGGTFVDTAPTPNTILLNTANIV